ncbi:sensor histidine kinase [Paenibacillus sp. GCM10027626]|uniref:sensor histidine kinase n=1 Tax=Paenibacillus sp. GCM10027626 TaxID=3273411 RepID=UPI00362650BC
MSMKRRLALRFTLQMTVGGLAALIVFVLGMNWILQRFSDISISKDFAAVGLEELVERSEFHEEGIRFDPALLEQVKSSQGWLQTLSPAGEVQQSYNTPPDVPKHYAPGELVDYWQQRKPFAYDILLWVKVMDGKEYTIIYGYHNRLKQLLELAVHQGRLNGAGELVMPQQLSSGLTAAQGFLQLIDAAGHEIASYNKPATIAGHYTSQDLALRNRYNDRYGYLYASSYEERTGHTWIVALPNYAGGRDGQPDLIPAETRALLIGGASMIGALIVIFILLSIWNAHRFGVPLLHILTWLNTLSSGRYEEPKDRKSIPRSRTREGSWRSRYRVFAEVLLSIGQLSRTLQHNAELRRQNNRLREEWIAGITHDLKTPLSSIKGYAHMLAEDSYQWSTEEVREFSRIILDKAAHMDLLMNDLALTYRLNAGIEPPEGERFELNEWLRNILTHAVAPPLNRDNIRFQPAEDKMTIKLYMPWLERIIFNLTANALLHNPAGTQLVVSVRLDHEADKLVIDFTDNGRGMDELTASRLFDRYYRGTDTGAASEGSGLGMAIAKGLVEAMGGHIEVFTSPGSGTTILLSWPKQLALAS